MTDPEVTGQDQPAVPDPAAPPASAPAAQEPITGHDPVIAQAPVSVAPRRPRRRAVFSLAALVVVAGLAAGLVVWAPWNPPPVLRPTGLVAGSSTANSIMFRWSRPRTGPLPDKYLILSSGTVAGSVARTVTSYRQAGLTPSAAYQYSVVAVRGGKRSPQSVLVTVRTLTPPLSQARLQGPWYVHVKIIRAGPGSRNGTQVWEISPSCAAGACDVLVNVKDGRHAWKMTLTRAGAVYRGQATVNFIPCRLHGITIPDPATLKFRVRVTAAAGESQVWAANSLAGTMLGTFRYVSGATFYCSAYTLKTSLRGTPV